MGFTPFGFDFESNSQLLEQTKAAYRERVPEDQRDRALVSDDRRTLLDAFRGYFVDWISEAMESLKKKPEVFSSCTSWKKLELPVNRMSYIEQFLQRVYQRDPSLPDSENSIEQILQKLSSSDPSPSDSENSIERQILQKIRQLNLSLSDLEDPEEDSADSFKKTTKALCCALIYCAYYSEEEYRTAFLRDVCAWWQEEIWENDPGKDGLLRYSAEQTGLPVEDLERLYMAQVRRILCSVLSGAKSYLESMSNLSRAKGVLNDLPQESKNWIQASIRKFREDIIT